MAIQDPKESTASVVSELKKQSSDGTNIISEYKDIFSKESGSDHKHDKVADDSSAALALLKTLVDEKKRSIAQESKRKKWDFDASPHVHFGKTLDDTFNAFLAWARVKDDGTKINVTKAFRRLESYADWMHDTGTDLTEPGLTAESVQKGVEAWAFNTSIDSEGRLVWWVDMGRLDIAKVKSEFTPEDHEGNIAKIGMIECFTLLPAKLATKLDRLTIGILPIRMQKIYMFESPTWVNVFMKIVGVFMSKKMKERMVFLKDWSEIDKIGGLEVTPKGRATINIL
ncbi:hypothetical protein ACHAXT_006538 [Thalassiosira profunda]